MAASSMSPEMFCSAAMNSSMNVPDVVNTAMRMNADMATDGPANQSHHVTPRKPLCVRAAGPDCTPKIPRKLWMTPRGSLNQLGPLIPVHDNTSLIAPEVENRNSHRTVIATVLVTDGNERAGRKNPDHRRTHGKSAT